jgi:hypothetical protein
MDELVRNPSLNRKCKTHGRGSLHLLHLVLHLRHSPALAQVCVVLAAGSRL